MRQSAALLSILASTVCAADIVSFYFPGGSSPAILLSSSCPHEAALTTYSQQAMKVPILSRQSTLLTQQ
jgi:hypothetical protein